MPQDQQDDYLSHVGRLFADQDFRGLPSTEKIKVLDTIVPDFSTLDPAAKAQLIQMHLEPGSFKEPSFGEKAMEFGGGVRAGALSTARHTEDLFRRVRGQPSILNRPDVKSSITPTPGLGEAGFAAEQATEFLLPIPGLSKLRAAGKAPGIVNLGLRTLEGAGREAVDIGAKTLLQTGDPEQAKRQAAVGAGFGAAGQVVGAAAPGLRRSAEKTYAQVLAPGSKADKFVTANKLLTPQGKDLLERRVAALTESGLKDKIARNLARSTDKLEQAWTALGPQRTHNLTQVLDELDQEAIRVATQPVTPGVQFETPGLPGRRIVNPELFEAYQNAGLDLIQRLGPQVDEASAFSLRRVRQILDRAVKDSFAGKELTSVQKEAKRAATDAIRNVLNKENPTIGEINKEYSFWRTADDVFENTNLRRVGQRRTLRAITRVGFGAAGGVLGSKTGSFREAAELAGLGLWFGGKLEDAMTSTAWKTVSSVTKNEIARLMVNGRAEQAATLAARATGQVNINPEVRKQLGLSTSRAASAPPPGAAPGALPSPPPGGGKVLGRWTPENRQLLAEASAAQGVPLPALYAIAGNENAAGDPNAVGGPNGGIGLMQVVRSTGAQFGAKDLTDPRQNVNASARLIRHLMDTFKQPELVLAGYRAGEGAVKAAGSNVKNMDPDVQKYVERGMRTWAALANPEQAKAAGY